MKTAYVDHFSIDLTGYTAVRLLALPTYGILRNNDCRRRSEGSQANAVQLSTFTDLRERQASLPTASIDKLSQDYVMHAPWRRLGFLKCPTDSA